MKCLNEMFEYLELVERLKSTLPELINLADERIEVVHRAFRSDPPMYRIKKYEHGSNVGILWDKDVNETKLCLDYIASHLPRLTPKEAERLILDRDRIFAERKAAKEANKTNEY